MQITLDTKPFSKIETEALVTYLFEDSDVMQGRGTKSIGPLAVWSASSQRMAKSTGKMLEFTLIHGPLGLGRCSIAPGWSREARAISTPPSLEKCSGRPFATLNPDP